jgi:hypothetical protein
MPRAIAILILLGLLGSSRAEAAEGEKLPKSGTVVLNK